VIKIKLLTFQGAPESLVKQGIGRVEKLLPKKNYELVGQDPDVLFFLTGGSELIAAKLVSDGKFYLLIGSRHDNSYASATEVKAYLNERNIPSMVLDEEEIATREIFERFCTVAESLKKLAGKRLGLIGKVSDWLISSTIPAGLLKSKLGISLVEIPWSDAGNYSDFSPSGDFLEFFSGEKKTDLQDTARVSEMLATLIKRFNLDAITVECFPMVQQHGVTACLPLARFNHEGIPAGCEGDLCSIAGMLLCKELTGIIPWMANSNKVTDEACVFSHCTIDPGLVSGYSVTTHFETGKGTSIAGSFKNDPVTIFRFDNKLSRAFIATAKITARPTSDTACRTQIEVKLSQEEAGILREHPLGNHHLILPGDHSEILKLACVALNIRMQ
jgi:L-fucose isomerase-like protein